MTPGYLFQVPQAVLRSILIHMRLTDPAELDAAASRAGVSAADRRSRCSSTRAAAKKSSRAGAGGGSGRPPSLSGAASSSSAGGRRHFWLPLTEERADFLLGLSDAVVKVV